MAYTWTDQGGYLASAALSKKFNLALQPKMTIRQFAAGELDVAGKRRGQTFNFDKVSNLATSGGAISETERIPETSVTITQGALTVTEYGISVPSTLKIKELSMLDTDSPLLKLLMADAAKTLDKAAEAALDECYYKYVACNGATTIGAFQATTATSTATSNLNAFHLKNMVDKLKDLNAPTISGFYFCLASIKATRGLHDDLEGTWKYTQYPVNGEVGKYYKTRVIEENNALDGSIGSGNVAGEAYLIGGDDMHDFPVFEGIVVPEEVRYKTGSTDYGRDRGLAWYYLGGFELIHQNDPNNTVIKFASA